MKKFKDFDAKKKYGYVKAVVDIPNWNEVLEIIDPNDLVPTSGDSGYAKEPHVTAFYGFHEGTDENVMKDFLESAMRNFREKGSVVRIGKISLFENDEFDVVKLGIESDDMRMLNNGLKIFPHEELHEGYAPHLTVAYVKSGTGKKYLGIESGAPATARISRLAYTGSNRNVKILVDL